MSAAVPAAVNVANAVVVLKLTKAVGVPFLCISFAVALSVMVLLNGL
jgi:hypothetical protein